MSVYRGVLHLHSTYSDGACSLAQLAELARAAGLDFLVPADHDTYLDRDRLARYVAECAGLSSDDLLIVPGVEFEREGRHVVAFGPDGLLARLDAVTVVNDPASVRAQGGFTIWAHPALTFSPTLHKPLQLPYDAWEIWNLRADGAHPCVPLRRALRRRSPRLWPVRPLAGADFHGGSSLGAAGLSVSLSTALSSVTLCEALRAGHYSLSDQSGPLVVDGQLSASAAAPLASTVRYAFTRLYCLAALARHSLLPGPGDKQSNNAAHFGETL